MSKRSIVKYVAVFGLGVAATAGYYAWHKEPTVTRESLMEYASQMKQSSDLEARLNESRRKEQDLFFSKILPQTVETPTSETSYQK